MNSSWVTSRARWLNAILAQFPDLIIFSSPDTRPGLLSNGWEIQEPHYPEDEDGGDGYGDYDQDDSRNVNFVSIQPPDTCCSLRIILYNNKFVFL